MLFTDLTEEPLLYLESGDDSELCATPTSTLGCSHESTTRSHRSDTGFRSLSSYSDNSGSCTRTHTPLANEVESSLDSGIQSQTQSRTRRSLERKCRLKRPDNYNTPGRVNAQAATFAGSSYKPRRGFSPLTVKIQGKSVASTGLASPPTTTSTASHQGTGTACGIRHDHFLPGHDYRHMRKHDGLGDFVMNDLDTDQQPGELLPPIPDMNEETETNDCDEACKSSANPPIASAPIDVPLSRKSSSATETSSASSSPASTANLSQSSTSSCWSLSSNQSNSPKDLSPEKSWKSSVLNFLHKFNPFSQDTRTVESPRVRTSHQQQDKYMLGLGFRM